MAGYYQKNFFTDGIWSKIFGNQWFRNVSLLIVAEPLVVRDSSTNVPEWRKAGNNLIYFLATFLCPIVTCG